MQRFVQAVLFVFVLIVLNGCLIVSHETTVRLHGNFKLIQSDCVFRLNGVNAQYENGANLVWHSANKNNINAFLLTFLDKEKQVTVFSILGTYQYDPSFSPYPLDLAYKDKTNALLVLNIHSLRKLESGIYKIYIEYDFNGQTNVCNFNVNSDVKPERKIVWPWDYYYGEGP